MCAAARPLASPDTSSITRRRRSRLRGNRGLTYVRANSAASSRVRRVTSCARRRGGSNTKSGMPRKLARHSPVPVPTYIMSDTLCLRRAPPARAPEKRPSSVCRSGYGIVAARQVQLSAGCPDLARRLSGPALERMRERTHLVKTKQPRNLGYMQPAVIEVANCEIAPQLLKYFSEVQLFVRKPSCKRPLAHSQTASNIFREHSSMRKHRRDRVLNSRAQLAHIITFSIG